MILNLAPIQRFDLHSTLRPRKVWQPKNARDHCFISVGLLASGKWLSGRVNK